jgi:integrase
MKHEPDVFLRLLWLMSAQHGWRSSQVALMKWRNIRYDANDRPIHIIADGGQEGFKTTSPVAAKLAPDVVETLTEWTKQAPDRLPEHTILPWRGIGGLVEPTRPLDSYIIRDWFIALTNKWKLPKLRPKDLRHWVATACRKANLSKQATAYLMGHDAAIGGAMRDWYDNPQLVDILDEQAEILPGGPLGLLEPQIKIVEGLPEEAVGLLRAYLDGQLGTMEFTNRIEAIKMKRAAKTGTILTQ